MSPRRRKMTYGLPLLALIVGGCTQLPTLTFNPEAADSGSQSGMDASLPDLDATVQGDAFRKDASAGGDAGTSGDSDSAPPSADAAEEAPTDDEGDEAGDAAPVKCGDAMVSNCAGCADGVLRCVTSTADYCIDDCTACHPGWLPCLHCPGANTAKLRGVCLPVNPATGLAACTLGNLCACDAATDCPEIKGAAQTCEEGTAKKSGCVTCGGSATTSNLVCASSTGDAGVCRIAADSSPTCE